MAMTLTTLVAVCGIYLAARSSFTLTTVGGWRRGSGPAMWKVYKSSKVLKDIFPDGKNKYLGWEWEFRAFEVIP